jgi:predicted nucleic acid-binding protein
MPLTPGGPPIFLGGQGPRGIGLAGRAAHGWLLPGDKAGDEPYFRAKRDLLRATIHAAGRSDEGFAFVGQVQCDSSALPKALTEARALRSAGATHIILGMAPSAGPEGLRMIAREVADDPLTPALENLSIIELDAAVAHRAGQLEPALLRSLDAVHLASALAVADELDALVTYDGRFADAARDVGLTVVAPT